MGLVGGLGVNIMASPEHVARGPAQKIHCVINKIRELSNIQRFFG